MCAVTWLFCQLLAALGCLLAAATRPLADPRPDHLVLQAIGSRKLLEDVIVPQGVLASASRPLEDLQQ